ncbi:MAG: choice-of-anchor D domain-containing protein [Candidatus Korobacteraceae bacterium]
MQEKLAFFLFIARPGIERVLGLCRKVWGTRGRATDKIPTIHFCTARLAGVLSTVCCVTLAGCGGVVLSPSVESSGPSLTVNASNVSFGNVTLDSPSTQSIVLTSSGLVPVKIDATTLSGAGFGISGMIFPAILNPGQTATINVQFLPTNAGPAAGELTIDSNSQANSTLQVALSGIGAAQAVSASYQVSLTWNAPTGSSDPVVGYDVYRSSGNAQYQLLNPSVDAQTSFADSDVQSGLTYQYYVTAVDTQGVQSVPSNMAEVTIP